MNITQQYWAITLIIQGPRKRPLCASCSEFDHWEANSSTTVDSGDRNWPSQCWYRENSDRQMVATSNWCIPVNSTLGWSSDTSCACEVILSFSVYSVCLRLCTNLLYTKHLNKRRPLECGCWLRVEVRTALSFVYETHLKVKLSLLGARSAILCTVRLLLLLLLFLLAHIFLVGGTVIMAAQKFLCVRGSSVAAICWHHWK